ncbi:MAG TPA: HD domain-containing protein [Anaerolineae bacterium]|nr:HD domain-containing protein [Anaerolineae bacterium]
MQVNLLERLRAFLAARETPAYLVGGSVRDVLLGRVTHDLDVSVQGDASELARAFADENGAAFFVMDQAFDVARVIFDQGETREVVDFARLRGTSLEMDLATRDFTINAMAADARTWLGADQDAVIDPFHGLADLATHRLRVVSADAFVNDPVRLLRAIRFEAELEFALDDAAENLVQRDALLINRAPSERVREEFMRILSAQNVLRQLERLDSLGLLTQVVPELNTLRGVTQSPPHIYDVFEHSLHAVAVAEETEQADYMDIAQGAFGEQLREHFQQRYSYSRRELLRLALLLHDIGKPQTRSVDEHGRIHFYRHEDVGSELAEGILRRLRFSNNEIAFVKTSIANHLRPILLAQSGVSDRAVYRFFRDTGEVGVDVAVHAWCDQRATYGDAMPTEIESALQATIGRLLDRYYHAREKAIYPPPLLTGNDVMEQLKLEPGPHIGALLDALREAQAVGQVTTREEALEFLRIFLSSEKL